MYVKLTIVIILLRMILSYMSLNKYIIFNNFNDDIIYSNYKVTKRFIDKDKPSIFFVLTLYTYNVLILYEIL